MKKNLYTNESKFTDEALELTRMSSQAVRELFNSYIAAGYDVREIAYTIQGAVRDTELEIICGV